MKDLDPIKRIDWTSPELLGVTLGMSRSSLSVQCVAKFAEISCNFLKNFQIALLPIPD